VFRDIERVVGRLARGDLTQPISEKHQDTFGRVKTDINDSLSHIAKVVHRLRPSADAIATASDGIAGGDTNLWSRSEQQASSLQQAAAGLEQLTSSARQYAESGGTVVGYAIQARDQINTASNKIAEIAFQTNLLAPNASGEAARPGPASRAAGTR